jgi:hypothetical protein
MILTIIHNFIKHSLIFISPFIIISLSIAINLPNTELHKKVLLEQDFYKKVSTEISKYSSDVINNKVPRSMNLEASINQSYIAYVLNDFSSSTWWQRIIESNLDNFENWLNNNDYQGDSFRLLWPDSQFKNTVLANTDKINEYIKQNSVENRECTLDEIKKFSDDLTKAQCYIKDLNSLTNQDKRNIVTGNLSKVNPVSFSWFETLRYIKLVFNVAKYLSVPVAIIYTLLVIFVIVSSYATKNSAQNTIVMILGRVGYSTFFTVGGILLGFYVTTFVGLQSASLLGYGVNIQSIQNLIQTQLFYHSFAVLSPALYVAIIFIIFHYIIKFLPKF